MEAEETDRPIGWWWMVLLELDAALPEAWLVVGAEGDDGGRWGEAERGGAGEAEAGPLAPYRMSMSHSLAILSRPSSSASSSARSGVVEKKNPNNQISGDAIDRTVLGREKPGGKKHPATRAPSWRRRHAAGGLDAAGRT